jgi:hypothetical protein
MEAWMAELTNWLTVFGGMSGAALAALIVLGAFGLAAFAIHAVLSVAKERRDGDA